MKLPERYERLVLGAWKNAQFSLTERTFKYDYIIISNTQMRNAATNGAQL
jgi:hypothetical protein